MKRFSWIRFLAAIISVLTCVACMLSMSVGAAEQQVETNEESDGEAMEDSYEAKKAAYREKLMSNDVTSDDFLIGSWVSFYSFDIDSYEYQLDQMAAAGINFNIFPKDFGEGALYDAAYWDDVEAQYAKRNMVYLMNGSRYEVHVAPGVEYAQGKEHCIGYHVADEPWANSLEHMGYIINRYSELDPTRYPFVNLYPSYAPTDRLGGTYYEYVSNFVKYADPEKIEYLSHDNYPFLSGEVTRDDDFFSDLEVIRKVAYENGKLKTHAFPQSSSWQGVRMPNATEMRWNVYAYLAYGFKALSWFNLVCPSPAIGGAEGFYESVIYYDGTIHDPELYQAWSDLNWEVRGLSDILMNQDVVHAYHVRQNTEGVEYLPEDFFLQPNNKYDFVVSVMEPKTGDDQYIMLFNKVMRRGLSCDFQVDPESGVKWVEYFDPNTGEYIPVEFVDGALKDAFEPGEGRLYRLRYDDPPSASEEETTEETTEVTTEATTETTVESTEEATTEATVDTTAEDTTEATVETTTEATTEAITETIEETVTTDSTAAITSKTEESATEEETKNKDADVASQNDGCGASVGFGTAAIIVSVAATAVFKKREE